MTATIREELEAIPYATDVDDNIESGKGQYTFRLDRYKISRMGLNEMDITSTLRAAVDGYTALDMWYKGEKQDVVISFDIERLDTNALLDLSFPTRTGEMVPLREVATVSLEPDYTTIQHFNGERNFTVSSGVAEPHTATEAITELKERLAKHTFPPGYYYEFGGENEDIQESFTAMFQAFSVAVLLIFSILVLQFNSFKQPFIIMFTVPFALIGVLPGLTLMGLKLTFPAIIGLVALTGIVVNDAIVLIDRINSLIREHGEDARSAVIDAGLSRLQPILLTTFTTIAGVLPLAFAQPMWAPLSWSIAFGLLVTTFLTLFLVPMLYISLEKIQGRR
jgi:HAE1 family hydrophobic/amphiphilic exporter-1